MYDVLERRAAYYALDVGLVSDCEDDIRSKCTASEDVGDLDNGLRLATAACLTVSHGVTVDEEVSSGHRQALTTAPQLRRSSLGRRVGVGCAFHCTSVCG